MTRHNLWIWGLLGAAIVAGLFVQKTRRSFAPNPNVLQSNNTVPPMNSPVIRNPPTEWHAPDRAWDLFTPPIVESELHPEVAEESREMPPCFSVEGYVVVNDAPAYVILRNTDTGQSHRLARQELIPDTDFSIADFYFDGPLLVVELSDGENRQFLPPLHWPSRPADI
ncbi:MAG: hypothetical protein LBF26_03455 [Puniceicoccales bacterium]|jgi:hypothetical protein|nr:hypothetical protein [Puniceicoccales bacterium]